MDKELYYSGIAVIHSNDVYLCNFKIIAVNDGEKNKKYYSNQFKMHFSTLKAKQAMNVIYIQYMQAVTLLHSALRPYIFEPKCSGEW